MAYAVITTVPVHDGSIDDLAQLFDETNRALVAGQDDWIGAWFTANRETSTVTVIAHWRDPDSYERFAASPPFQATMARFSDAFTGPPTTTVNEILVDMAAQDADAS